MYVHIWQTNALGIYSAVANAGQNGEVVTIPPGEPGSMKSTGHGGPGDSGMGPTGGRLEITSDERWLRGYQITNEDGQVSFKTIIPGWYTGRSLHIHIEVYPKNTTERKDILYVGQLFFHQGFPLELKFISPYSKNTQPILLNSGDKHYNNFGNETILDLISNGRNKYASSITLGINPDALKTSN